MDEERIGSPAPKQEAPKPKKRKKRVLWGRVIALILLLVMAAGLVFFAIRGVSSLVGSTEDPYADIEPYSYETGSGQTFAPVGEGFAVASSSSVQLLDGKGKTLYKSLVSFETPAVFGCDSAALFCDIGGTDVLYVKTDGTVTELETGDAILSGHLNDSGYFALLSQQAGYKGLVQVYDKDCQLLYQWWSGTAYALRALVSPDDQKLATLSVGQEGSEIQLFSLSSEEALWSVSFGGELLFDLSFLSDGSLCAISEKNLWFLDSQGEIKATYALGDTYLSDYDLSSGDLVLICTNPYRTGAGGTVTTLDANGALLGSLEISRDIIAMRARDKELLIMTSGDISLYDQELRPKGSLEELMTARDALLLPEGKALLLSAYAAEELKF